MGGRHLIGTRAYYDKCTKCQVACTCAGVSPVVGAGKSGSRRRKSMQCIDIRADRVEKSGMCVSCKTVQHCHKSKRGWSHCESIWYCPNKYMSFFTAGRRAHRAFHVLPPTTHNRSWNKSWPPATPPTKLRTSESSTQHISSAGGNVVWSFSEDGVQVARTRQKTIHTSRVYFLFYRQRWSGDDRQGMKNSVRLFVLHGLYTYAILTWSFLARLSSWLLAMEGNFVGRLLHLLEM